MKNEANEPTRRQFLKTVGQAGLVFAFGSGLSSCATIAGQPEVEVKYTVKDNNGTSQGELSFGLKVKLNVGSGNRRGRTSYSALNDTLVIENTESTDIILAEFIDDPTSLVLLAPGQSIEITEVTSGVGTIANTSSTQIAIGDYFADPATSGTYELL